MTSERTSSAPEDVLLIHGTFAGLAPGSEATTTAARIRWWQAHSQAWTRLRQLLPPSADLPKQGEEFFWASGPNSERARRKAGHELMIRLQELERSGRGYHLVGHSHGGSVIWEALRQVVLDGNDQGRVNALPNLRSWTTLGTPFLHYEKAPLPGGGVRFMRAYTQFYAWFEDWLASWGVVRSMSRLAYSIMAVLLAYLFAVLLVILPVVALASAQEQALAMFIFEVFLLAMIGPVLAGVRQTVERMEIAQENTAARIAMAQFGERWLGIYSEDDEAINGLRATIGLELRVVPRRTAPDSVFSSDTILRLTRPLSWASDQLFNRFAAPAGDRFVATQVARSSQGNDRPGVVVTAVGPGPIAFLDPPDCGRTWARRSYPPLPGRISAQLVHTANEHAKYLVPEVRRALATHAELSVLTSSLADSMSGMELVHTLYYQNADVLALVAQHIANPTGEERSRISTSDQELAAWLQHFKRSVRQEVLGPLMNASSIASSGKRSWWGRGG